MDIDKYIRVYIRIIIRRLWSCREIEKEKRKRGKGEAEVASSEEGQIEKEGERRH